MKWFRDLSSSCDASPFPSHPVPVPSLSVLLLPVPTRSNPLISMLFSSLHQICVPEPIMLIYQPAQHLTAPHQTPILTQLSPGLCRTLDALGEVKMILGIKALQIYKKFSGPFKPVEGPSMGNLDQQEIPALHLHNVSPGNVVCFTSTRTQASINM